jgi:hypothetical protein
MRAIGLQVWVLLATLALPQLALAQESGSVSGQPVRRWDAGGGVGIRFGQTADVVVPAGDWSAEVGRYWTAHIKTSLAVATAGEPVYSGEYSSSASGYRLTSTTPRPATLSGAVTYQFHENVFVHPYVTAGVRLAWVSEIRNTYSYAPYQLVSTDTLSTTLQARPVVGGGFKSYFSNGRAFMRSELLLAIDPHGSPHTLLRVGAGVDF